MKRVSSHWLPSGTPVCALIVSGVLVFAGCGRQHPAAEVSATGPAAGTNSDHSVKTPGDVPPATPVTVTPGTDGGADLKQLNHAYIGWIVQNHRRPKTFEEFIAQSGITVPPAPAGKKYVIEQNGFINLVSQ